MLFIFPREGIPTFWMKNVLIPLDMVFLDSAGIVVDITEDARPCKVEPCPHFVPIKPAVAVLEINSGSAQKHEIRIGSKILFQRVPDYPKKQPENEDSSDPN